MVSHGQKAIQCTFHFERTGRQDNLDLLHLLRPNVATAVVDLMDPPPSFFTADIVFAEHVRFYFSLLIPHGAQRLQVLYHLEDPSIALQWASAHVNRDRGLFIASTCISADDGNALNKYGEGAHMNNQVWHLS